MKILTIDCDWACTHEKFIDVIKYCLSQQEHKDVIFVKEHHFAALYIPKNTYLFNLDHHNDLGCNLRDKGQANAGIAHKANWIRTLMAKDFLNGYHLIHNYDSPCEHDDYVGLSEYKLENLDRTYDINLLYKHSFDKIIVCESYTNVHPRYKMLYSILKLLFKNGKEPECKNLEQQILIK